MRNITTYGVCMLAHKDFKEVSSILDYYSSEKVPLVLHIDQSSPKLYDDLHKKYKNDVNINLISEVHCGWGDWSLVDAELRCYKVFIKKYPNYKYIHFMSSSDRPIKSHHEFSEFLEGQKHDFIQVIDITKRQFSLGGHDHERFKYFYPFNFVSQNVKFELLSKIQKKMRISRTPPFETALCMGGQFKTLKTETIIKVLNLTTSNREILPFFRLSWIPDESFFPSMLNWLKSKDQTIKTLPPLTQVHFTTQGRPVRFYLDNLHLLDIKRHWFARKFYTDCTTISIEHLLKKIESSQILEEKQKPLLKQNPAIRKPNYFLVSYTKEELHDYVISLSNANTRNLVYAGSIDETVDLNWLDNNKLSLDKEIYKIWHQYKYNNLHSFLENMSLITSGCPLYSISSNSLKSYRFNFLLHNKQNRFIFSKDMGKLKQIELLKIIEPSLSRIVRH